MLKCGMCSMCVDRAIPCVPKVRRKRGPPNQLEREQRARRAASENLPPCAAGPQPILPPSQPRTAAGAPLGGVLPRGTGTCTTNPPPPAGGLCGTSAGAAPPAVAQAPIPNAAEPLLPVPPGLGLNPLHLQLGHMGASLFGGPLLPACLANPVLAAAYMHHPFIPATAAFWAAAAGIGLPSPHRAGDPAPPFGLALPYDPSAALGAPPPVHTTSACSAAPHLADSAHMSGGAHAPQRSAVHQQLPPLGVPAPIEPRLGAPP